MKYLDPKYNNLIDVLNILYKIPGKYITFNKPATEDSILSFEKKRQVLLPDDYKLLLKHCNGFNLLGAVILGVPSEDETCFSIDDAFQIEHFQVRNPMPLHLIPFSPDGGGNYYCFDIRNDKIVFWDSEYDYSNDIPEVVYNTLADMIREVCIEWSLEDLDINK
jgi:hypothetical protein